MTEIRTGQSPAPLTREQFQERFNARFYDPAFDAEHEASPGSKPLRGMLCRKAAKHR